MTDAKSPGAAAASALPWTAAAEYGLDAWQRSVLFLDVLRQRGNQYLEHMAMQAPNVLQFEAELVVDGRALPRPVNYVLARIIPPNGVTVDQRKRPFVVVDPRAGHGPGIGGFKADSEIGVAMRAGHPCYFVGFLPEPVPGQTIEDIMVAEAAFLERVIELHPDADGKPVVIGNCQAGWAMMMVAATRPELFGPIIIAGAPLSYWAGVHGRNPMRYTGGLNGGSWLTALTGDLGRGIFDGACLVQNFENMNPSNTLWTKQYNVYANVDTEGPRYLGFEKWWGGHVLLNAEEMQWIVDNLFVGNKLATAEIVTGDGMPPRSAQHQVADHLLLLAGRRHHAAAAGAGLDPRPLRQRRGHPRQRPDHRLLRPRQDRASGHLRLGRRRQEGARRVRQQHRLHRLPAARPLRGGADAGGRGHRAGRVHDRRLCA